MNLLKDILRLRHLWNIHGDVPWLATGYVDLKLGNLQLETHIWEL